MGLTFEGSRRNVFVERAVQAAISRVDDFISGRTLELPSPAHRRAVESILTHRSGSVRLAALFFAFYWLEDSEWDLDHVPIGIRGTFGDKLLSEALTSRSVTFHNTVTAFGENLGWKGNVRSVRLSNDARFQPFLTEIADAVEPERIKVANLLAHRFAESRRETSPLPPVGPDILTFAHAKALLYRLLRLRSEGHIQQFVIAALLREYRVKEGVEVRTHHPHAADKYDETAGDIEEVRDGEVVRAYEVTIRDDWKNRISNFSAKMDRFHLNKYVIIASGVNDDDQWSVPAKLVLNLEPYSRDVAIIDIRDVVNFLAAELSPVQLRNAVNLAYDFLSDRKLSGRNEFREAFRAAVGDWLDASADSRDGAPE